MTVRGVRVREGIDRDREVRLLTVRRERTRTRGGQLGDGEIAVDELRPSAINVLVFEVFAMRSFWQVSSRWATSGL